MRKTHTTYPYVFFLCAISMAQFSLTDASAQNVLYVHDSASGSATGASWDDAFVYLQNALAVAVNGDEIWVATGRYTPDLGRDFTEGDRSAWFEISAVIGLYGGFQGGETERSQRDPSLNETVLSGDLLNNDLESDFPNGPSRAENSGKVIFVPEIFGLPAEDITTIDGFTIEGSQISSSPSSRSGALTIPGRPFRLSNLVVRNNVSRNGGGAAINVVYENGSISNVQFRNNHTEERGGGLKVSGFGSLIISNCLFDENVAEGSGGAIYSQSVRTTIVRTTFSNNESLWWGGAALFDESVVTIWNSSFYSNSADKGAGALDVGGDDDPDNFTAIIGSIFYGNRTDRDGGAINSSNHSNLIVNTTFADNSAGRNGAAIYLAFNHPKDRVAIQNSIFWGNTTDDVLDTDLQVDREVGTTNGLMSIFNSIFQGELHSTFSVIEQVTGSDPLFVSPLGIDGLAGTEDDDFRLTAFSPGVDGGNNDWLPTDSLDLDQDGLFWENTPVDLDERHRAFSTGEWMGTVDIGAYEYGSPAVSVGIDSEPSHIPGSILLELYPSPASEFVILRMSSASTRNHMGSSLLLYDLIGREVKRWSFSAPSLERRLDLSNISPGVYWMTLLHSEGSESVSIVITN